MNQQSQTPVQSGQPPVNKGLLVVLIIVVLIGVAFAAWYYLMGPGKKVATSTTTATTTPATTTTPSTTTTTTTTTPATTATADWLTYTNSAYGFSFKYPKDYSVTEDQKNGTVIINYPTGGLSRGMTIYNIKNSNINDEYNKLKISAGYTVTADKTIDGIIWKSLSYDPKNDTKAGDAGKENIYFVEKNGKLYQIVANIGEPLENITAVQADENANGILSTFTFTK